MLDFKMKSIEAIQDIVMIGLIVIFYLVIPVGFVVSTTIAINLYHQSSFTSDMKYNVALPKGISLPQNCGVGQASSKAEAQKVADETGCPAYY